MNLVYVTATFPFGNAETFLIPEIEYLSESNEGSVVVVPLRPRGARRLDWSPDKSNICVSNEGLVSRAILLGALKTIMNHPLRSLGALRAIVRLPARHLVKNAAVYLKAMWLASQVERLKIDHIHVQWAGTTATFGMLAARVAGIEWSLTCHRWDIYENNLLAAKSDSASFIRFISRRGKSDALKLGVKEVKAIVIPMGVNRIHANEPRRLRERVPVIMCAANLVEVKGHTFLFQAVALLIAAGIPVFLKLAGDGPLRPYLELLANSLNLTEQVEFLGHLDRNQLFTLYETGVVDLFVLPSVDLGNGHHEGVPVSLMEAMCFGIPVISTKTGSIEELLAPELGLTVRDRDPEALAGAIASLITRPDEYEAISRQVIGVVRNGWLIQNAVQKLSNHIHSSNGSSPANFKNEGQHYCGGDCV